MWPTEHGQLDDGQLVDGQFDTTATRHRDNSSLRQLVTATTVYYRILGTEVKLRNYNFYDQVRKI